MKLKIKWTVPEKKEVTKKISASHYTFATCKSKC